MEDKFLFSVVVCGEVFYRKVETEPDKISSDEFSLWTCDEKKAKPVSLQFISWYLGHSYMKYNGSIQEYHIKKV